jgi:hypothetical protein
MIKNLLSKQKKNLSFKMRLNLMISNNKQKKFGKVENNRKLLLTKLLNYQSLKNQKELANLNQLCRVR